MPKMSVKGISTGMSSALLCEILPRDRLLIWLQQHKHWQAGLDSGRKVRKDEKGIERPERRE